MAHPFTKLFDAALKRSTPTDNQVLVEARLLKAKGYGAEEIHGVLIKMQHGLVRDEDHETAKEAAQEIGTWLD